MEDWNGPDNTTTGTPYLYLSFDVPSANIILQGAKYVAAVVRCTCTCIYKSNTVEQESFKVIG